MPEDELEDHGRSGGHKIDLEDMKAARTLLLSKDELEDHSRSRGRKTGEDRSRDAGPSEDTAKPGGHAGGHLEPRRTKKGHSEARKGHLEDNAKGTTPWSISSMVISTNFELNFRCGKVTPRGINVTRR